jgi:3-dehydroquinate dehydratase II
VRVAVLNGVNLDVLHRRDAELYGGLRLNQLESRIYEWARQLELLADCRQTNSEAEYVGWCHDAFDWAGGVVVNPGAWTHYSYAIRDALEMLEVPIVEVHLSNIDEREEWRRRSVLHDVVAERIVGKGPDGYRDALVFLAEGRT